jgi:hypothetical protein
MKAPIIFALGLAPVLLASAGSAQAKLVVGEPQAALAVSVDDTAIATGPSGALLESNYFNAPQAPTTFGRGNSCRLPLSLFVKTRLAQSCN